MVGFAFNRWVLQIPAVVEMTRAEVVNWVGPILVAILTDPTLGRHGV